MDGWTDRWIYMCMAVFALSGAHRKCSARFLLFCLPFQRLQYTPSSTYSYSHITTPLINLLLLLAWDTFFHSGSLNSSGESHLLWSVSWERPKKQLLQPVATEPPSNGFSLRFKPIFPPQPCRVAGREEPRCGGTQWGKIPLQAWGSRKVMARGGPALAEPSSPRAEGRNSSQKRMGRKATW